MKPCGSAFRAARTQPGPFPHARMQPDGKLNCPALVEVQPQAPNRLDAVDRAGAATVLAIERGQSRLQQVGSDEAEFGVAGTVPEFVAMKISRGPSSRQFAIHFRPAGTFWRVLGTFGLGNTRQLEKAQLAGFLCGGRVEIESQPAR